MAESQPPRLEGTTEIDTANRAGAMPTIPALTDLAVTLISASTHSEAYGMQRRTFILRLGGTSALGGALGLAGPGLAVEAARHGLTLSFAEERAEAAVEEWQEIVSEYGYTYYTNTPVELFDSLLVDVLGVQYAINRDPADAALAELRRVAGFLAGFMAMTVANLGRTREARRWWRTARRHADASGDLESSLWIRGREVVRAPYERRPLPAVLQLAEEAESRVARGARAARSVLPELHAGTALSLARAGRHAEAARALEQVEETFADLPSATANDHDSLFGWAEVRLRFTESSVFSLLGDLERADEAQRRALALCAASHPRRPTLIELQRAFCLVRGGDVTNGARHAVDTMAGLPREHYVREVVDLGQKVLEAVPASERRRAGVTELGEYLALV
jgi:hypothetical protein